MAPTLKRHRDSRPDLTLDAVALSEMAAELRAPSLPGHDEPAPEFLQNVWRIYG